MSVSADRRKPDLLARLSGATALAVVLASVIAPRPASAQVPNIETNIPSDSQMLLEADQLVYDQNANTVTAQGGVQIDYGGNKLVADAVSYNRETRRLVARGNVHVVESSGNNIYTDEIDITDDFGEGFVNQLRIETVDKTYFAAESADRKDGNLTTFNNGVYTACEPCEEKPNKAPIWRIKSRKIIWDARAKEIRFERSSFELFGLPIASIPYFVTADPTVKRKSGFLFPTFTYDSELGAGVGIPYYFALSPTYDLTLTGTGYSKQGFLAEAEWRQRFNNGQYMIKGAGIRQLDPWAFDSYTIDRSEHYTPSENQLNKNRFMVGSEGQFNLNERWTFGWDVLYQTDKNFSRTYGIDKFQQSVQRSEVYLTGLGDRNYFDLRGMKFDVQEDTLDGRLERSFLSESLGWGRDIYSRDDKQPWVLPSFDYSWTADEPVVGGELNIDINSRTLNRDERDLAFDYGLDDLSGNADDHVFAVRGAEGFSHRTTAEAEWQRILISESTGLVVTPLLHMQGDVSSYDRSDDSVAAIGDMANNLGYDTASLVRSEYFRAMATAGLDVRWPVLFSTTSATHILEPIGQVFVRPDEARVADLGLPNEDAQSMVFDATTLFVRDKFSGYDRMEGGTRANIGMRYVGSFSNGWTANATFGQSYHLGGRNSFASPDLVNVGAASGLEHDASDYVGLVGIATPNGWSGSLSGRFDRRTFEVARFEARAAYTSAPLSLNAKYAHIAAQPLYGFREKRHEVSIGGRKKIGEFWNVFGTGTYDIQNDLLVSNSFGIGYADECFSFMLTYGQTRKFENIETRKIDESQSIGFNLSFRTIGDFGSSTGAFDKLQE